MFNILKIFLSSILICNFTTTAAETLDKVFISLQEILPFHPDIKISNTANQTNRQEIGRGGTPDKDIYAGTTEIKWTDYAYSWDQFKKYYKTISLSASGYADAKEATKSSFTNVNITIANLEKRNSWHDNSILKASGSKWCLAYTARDFTWGSWNQSGVYYDAYMTDSYIKVRFYLWTKAFQAGWGSMWTESHIQYSGGIISSSWNVNTIKESLNTALSNQIDLESSYSGSLQDKNNINDPTGKGNDETTLINSVIAKILGNEYSDWKKYIQPFTFSDATREAIITIKFDDPKTKTQQVWVFHTPINITLSKEYWGKSLSKRLHIKPGQIVNPEDSTKGMIEDSAIQLEPDQVTENYGGNLQYHTTADIQFDGMEDSSEWMTVNGEPVEVLNNKFFYHMLDNRVNNGNEATNTYDIIIYHDDGINKNQYQIKYTINNLVPSLSAKWYAWAPDKNPDQKKLVDPTLPNGKPNPDYDKEINRETGTKTQIIWVKKKSQYPFPLDPLNKKGEVIDPNKNAQEYDLGFIAEGSVAGKGVQQLFKPEQLASVAREGVDNALNQFTNPNDKQQLTAIIPDTDNKYWSWQGMWHYITKTSDGLAYEKYVLIGPKYNDKYPRFLDVLDNSNVAVDFWTTIHGTHLKNFLIAHKNLDSKDIGNLNYEQVVSYWKEYTSGIISQTIPPDPNPINMKDLNEISFDTIKMNLTTVDLIKEEIKKQVKKQLTKSGATNLVYDEDYQFQPFDNETIAKLLDYDSAGSAMIDLNINALATSTKAIGSNKIIIINNTHFDPDKVFDLSTINPWSYTQNFSQLTVEKLKENWILGSIAKQLIKAKAELVYQTDYGVRPLNDEILQQFLTNEKRVSLIITIYAQDTSIKAINHTSLELINDPDGEIAPPIPPDPDPDPKPLPPDGNSWIAKKTNLIIMSIVTILIIGASGTVIFFKYRLKKGIGGKKKKNLK